MKTDQLPDAPPSIDASPRGTVHVTVLDPGGTGAPAVGANVVFVDPDGTVVKKVATDIAGKADADVLPGASVTAITLVNTSTALQTLLAVKPGDDLIIGIKSVDSSTAGDFTITFPALAGAATYSVTHSCGMDTVNAPAAGGPPPAAKVTITNSCRQDTMEIVVVAQNANGLLMSLAKTGVAFVAGGSATLTGTYQNARSFTASYTNIDPVIANLNMMRFVPDAAGFFSQESAQTPGSSLVLTVTSPVANGGQVFTQASNSTGSAQSVRQAISGGAATYGLDVGATLLPWLSTPTYDAAANKVIVPLDTTGTSAAKPDLFRMTLSYRRVDANNVSHSFAWQIFGPDAADVVLPTLPADLGGIAPTASDTVSVTQARMFEADTVAGYDAIRNDVNKAVQQYTGNRPQATTVRISSGPGRMPL